MRLDNKLSRTIRNAHLEGTPEGCGGGGYLAYPFLET
jgi:hypothetical protein